MNMFEGFLLASIVNWIVGMILMESKQEKRAVVGRGMFLIGFNVMNACVLIDIFIVVFL